MGGVLSMPWLYLILAGCFEVACTTMIRYVDGWARPWALVGLVLLGAGSLGLLYKALQGIPIGTAYAVWTGLGAAGTVVVGILFYKEPTEALRLVFLTTLIGSIVGLKLVSHE